MESLIKYVQDEYIDQKNFPEFKAGDTITVYYEIKEGEKSRTQFFNCLLYTSPSPRDAIPSRMPSSA